MAHDHRTKLSALQQSKHDFLTSMKYRADATSASIHRLSAKPGIYMFTFTPGVPSSGMQFSMKPKRPIIVSFSQSSINVMVKDHSRDFGAAHFSSLAIVPKEHAQFRVFLTWTYFNYCAVENFICHQSIHSSKLAL